MPLPPPFEARLVHARQLSPSVRELAFERTDALPMAFEPGQWVNVLAPAESIEGARAFETPGETAVRAPGGGLDVQLKRSYSIASPPDGSPRFELAVTRVQGGPISTWLHAVGVGAVLRFSGPQGFFTRPAAGAPPALMIATGTGVTPMRSMIRAAAAAGARAPVRLLLGVRHEEDVLYGDEFSRLMADDPLFVFEATLSQPRGAWSGRRGYVQAHVRDLWERLSAESAAPPHAYVCGLERMVGSVRDLLRKDMGLPRQQVHSERYD
ncbi:MAG TPA: FAD-binding oxidoreductase [Polyangiaceae bacterium]|nr:FAD-binding oxidoreductase [Polyangiaceae bacterium]